MTKIYKLIFLILSSILLISFFSSCSSSKGNDFTYEIISEPENMDPQVAEDISSLIVISNVFEGLMRYDEDDKLVCALAEDYQVSNNNLEYTFNLKKDAKWSNDKKITADDFVFAFRRIFLKDTKSPGVKLFSSILNSDDVYNNNKNIESLGVVAVDEDTVKFTLSSEDKSFLSNLTQPSAMPCNEEFFNETKGKYGLERTSLIYSGPFKISSWTHDSFIYITQNQGYVTTEVFPKSIDFRIETDYEKRLENFQKDDSVAINVEFKDVDKFQSEKYSKTIFNDTVWTLAFNLNDEDMQSENLRKALINCFDRNAYKENMNEYHSFATTIIPPIMTVGDINYNQKYSDVFNYSYNPSQAKESYNKFLSEKEIERLKGATILVPDDNLHRYNISYIQQIWQKELGIFINLELLPSNDIEKKISKGDFKMAIVPIKADGNNIGSVLSRFLSDNSKNYFGFNNENFDKNLLNAQGVKDYNKVIEYYHTCENILKDSYFLVPMYFQSSIYINKSNVLGIDYSPYGNVIKFQKARLK